MVYCQECGTEVSELADFCPDCGARIRDGAPETQGVEEKSATETLRWAWETLTDTLPIVGVFALIGVFWVAMQFSLTAELTPGEFRIPLWFWPALVVYVLATTAAQGAASLAAEEAVAGGQSSLESKLLRAVKRVPAVVAIGLLVAVPILVGLVLFVIPGVYLALRFQLATPACFIDRKGPIESIKTSWSASSGNVGKLFVIGLVIAGVSFVGGAFSGIVGLFVPVVDTLTTAVLTAIVAPLTMFAISRVYLEQPKPQ